MNISRKRGKQAASSSGLGVHFSSPVKARNPKRKTHQQAVTAIGTASKRQRLEAQLAQLLIPAPSQTHLTLSELADNAEGWNNGTEGLKDSEDSVRVGAGVELCDLDMETSELQTNDRHHIQLATSKVEESDSGKSRRITPNQANLNLFAKWRTTLPTLVDDLLAYYGASIGHQIQPVTDKVFEDCPTNTCAEFKSFTILALYFDHFSMPTVKHCSCRTAPQVLVKSGLFPTAPSQTRMAFSIDFLDFYSALFERSCDAVNAMAAALNSFYSRRGFQLLNKKDEKFREPFRRGLGYAAQWLDMLRVQLEQRVDVALNKADQMVQEVVTGEPLIQAAGVAHEKSSNALPAQSSLPQPSAIHTDSECARVLRQLCPACFACSSFGRPLAQGGDFQICTDGNFHHRHLVSGGHGVPFHDPRHIIPKSFVDEVGIQIAKARKTPPKARKPQVPDEAIDECQSSYEAADGDKKKATSGSNCDAQGWMSLICRHDVPLFFANIDTPGEQQKYAVALILWFYRLIPLCSTVTVLYDIGCVLHRSTELYNIFPPSIASRMRFATTAMHAYGHQWSCQLRYNPRLQPGLGLSDGEGVERTWSKLRKLIVLVRTSSLARRAWLTDRQLDSISMDLRDSLGDWINNRLKRGVKEQGTKAQEALNQCSLSITELREQWALQQEAQLSIRAHAPARLKKELDTVITLQTELEDIEKAIQTAKSALSSAPKKSAKILKSLSDTHQVLNDEVEKLYLSLNVHESFPDLEGVDLEFVRTLLMARDLKINIRKRAIGSFFEWDRLDQAVGGRNQALGTKLHQHTRKAIAKRQPALMNAIKKFNRYCERLAELYDPSYKVPLPAALPLKLADLRDNSNLMEDVWITPSVTDTALWLEDEDVRNGIRAMLKVDRCLEEQRRLGWEADNLCRWFGRELTAVEVALQLPENLPLVVQLRQHRDHIIHLKSRWISPMASAIRFEAHIAKSKQAAAHLTSPGSQEEPISWINLNIEIEESANGPLSYIFVDDQPDDSELKPVDSDFANSETASDPSDVILSESLEQASTQDDDHEEIEDSSSFTYQDAVHLIWKEERFVPDNQLIIDAQSSISWKSSKHLYTTRTFGKFDFDENELHRLDSTTALLNDGCINGLAHYFQGKYLHDANYHYQSQQCAIFSTHDLVRIRYKASDKDIWRSVARLEYWSKNIWIIPIHRPRESHWVLAVIYVLDGQILVYDSLAGKRSWLNDLELVSVLIHRLAFLANANGCNVPRLPMQWAAKPVVMRPVQSNDHDCGLWVVAWIAATLRGFSSVGLNFTEAYMPLWRSHLAVLVRSLPFRKPKT